MAKYVTKDEIVQSINTEDSQISPRFPLLAFNNEEQDIQCDNCGSIEAKAFRYNAAVAAGTDSVVFEWAPKLYRVMARGYTCHRCNWHKIVFEYPEIDSHKENNEERVENVEIGSSELVSESSGLSADELKHK